jgi:hypothetical protein
MNVATDKIESFGKSECKFGFVSEIETEAFSPKLSGRVARRFWTTEAETDSGSVG